MQCTHSTHLCLSVHGCTTCTMHTSEAPKAAFRAQIGHCSIVTGTLRTSQVLCRHQDSAGQPAGGKMGLAAICTMFEVLGCACAAGYSTAYIDPYAALRSKTLAPADPEECASSHPCIMQNICSRCLLSCNCSCGSISAKAGSYDDRAAVSHVLKLQP